MTNGSKTPGLFLRNAGLFNPVLVQAVGLCPVVAMATSLRGSALLALVAAVVITLSELIASLCMKRIVRWVRIALYILLGGVLVLPFMMFLEKHEPELFSSLGLYLPIMAVNSLVVLRCERFAVKIKPISALKDGLTASFGYAAVLIAVGSIREILGSGSIGGFVFKPNHNLTGLLLPFGGFLMLGFFAAFLRSIISAYWPRYLDRKQPKPHVRRKPKKAPVPVEPETLPDLTPDDTPFSLDDIQVLPTETVQDEVEESETEEAVYTPLQPEEMPQAVEPEPDPVPPQAPQVGDVFTKANEPEKKDEPSGFMKRMNHCIEVQQHDTNERVRQAQEHKDPQEKEHKDYSAFAMPMKERKPAEELSREKIPLLDADDELEALLSRSLDDVMGKKKEDEK